MTLDGINVTDESEGGYLVNGLIASFPIPVDAVQEFRGTVSNPTEDQNRSGGGQFALTVRRGSNDWHGLAYDYYQNAALNANSWSNNRTGAPRPGLISNRFGGTFGGPFLKDKAYFFLAYEGFRFPNSANVTQLGITEPLRTGILRFKDAAGNLNSYNFNPANGPLTSACGPTGNQPCDPRGVGLSPDHQPVFQVLPRGQQPHRRRRRHQHWWNPGTGLHPCAHRFRCRALRLQPQPGMECLRILPRFSAAPGHHRSDRFQSRGHQGQAAGQHLVLAALPACPGHRNDRSAHSQSDL